MKPYSTQHNIAPDWSCCTRHEAEVEAAAVSSKTELSHVTKELETTKATLAQRKMSAETLHAQVSTGLFTAVNDADKELGSIDMCVY